MKQHTISNTYLEYHPLESLDAAYQRLAKAAMEATRLAYAPYSNFRVGAAVLLENGEIVLGSNKENASFPAGICAERSALSQSSDRYPGVAIEVMAITARSEEFNLEQPPAPCGICRQVMCEYEKIQSLPIKLILLTQDRAYLFNSVSALLPLHFYLSDLKNK